MCQYVRWRGLKVFLAILLSYVLYQIMGSSVGIRALAFESACRLEHSL